MRQASVGLLIIAVTALFGSIIRAQARPAGAGRDSASLRLERTIMLPGVKGRIDHMAVDTEGRRLFIAALGNNTVEVVDLRSGKRIHSMEGLHEPQDVSYASELGRIFVSNGGDGSLNIYDSRSFRLIDKIAFGNDADNLRYDSQGKYLFVGYGNGALGIVDARSSKIMGRVVLAGHPESFQLERTGPKIFINIPTAKQVAVVDRGKKTVVNVWPLKASENFAMALDEKRHRIFICCRRPARMLIFDTGSGKEVSSMEIGHDVDDIYYDEATQQIYVSCGEGIVDIIRQIDADHYELAAKMKTASGARTSLFAPEWMRLFVAVPAVSGRTAEIRVYAIK